MVSRDQEGDHEDGGRSDRLNDADIAVVMSRLASNQGKDRWG